jgi:LemA protein
MNRKGFSAIAIILIILGSIVLVTLIGAGIYFGTYNSLVTQRVAVDATWSEVQNQYQRRYDLIPQLVNSTKMYINFEKNLLTDIALARSQWGASLSKPIQDQMTAQGSLDSVLARLMVVVTTENYPQLKSDQVVLALMDELAGTQNRVAVARGRYIDAIQSYNTAIRVFPNNIVAGMNGFTTYPNYQANTGADTNPTVPIG